MDWLTTVSALCMGVALSASCGFRVFLPLLALSIGVRWFGVPVSDGFGWVASDAALVCLAVATVLEIAAYYIPVVDNALDAVQGPLALVAGAIVMAGLLGDLPPYLQWGVGIVGGAGAAGTVKTLTSSVRLGSTATTGGLGNCVVSTAENGCAVVGSTLALVVPILAAALLLLAGGVVVWFVRRSHRRRLASGAKPA